MAILEARLRDRSDSPDLMVLVDEIPNPEDMVYELKKFSRNRTMYRSLASNGLVLYGIHNPDDQTGFYGRPVKIKDTEGIIHGFRGPWASRASVMNEYFDNRPHIKEVLVTAIPKHFEGGYLSSAYAMEIPTLNEWLSTSNFGWLFMPTYYDYAPNEPNYELQRVNENSPHAL